MFRFNLILAAIAAGTVHAHPQVAEVPLYTTVTYDICPVVTTGSTTITTNGLTLTYPATLPAATYTTVYTTTYVSLCPTGITSKPYTITETCVGASPTFSTGTGHIPPGFTTTAVTCNSCGPTPTVVTITEPCGCTASEGVVVVSKPTAGAPTSAGIGGSVVVVSGSTASAQIVGVGGSSVVVSGSTASAQIVGVGGSVVTPAITPVGTGKASSTSSGTQSTTSPLAYHGSSAGRSAFNYMTFIISNLMLIVLQF